MRGVLIYFSIIMICSQVIAQSSFNGLYTNDVNEFICFNNDTVWFRINYHDAFGSFSIGKGEFKVNKKGDICTLKSNLILSQTSVLKRYPRSDKGLVITVLNMDSVPIKYVYISLKKLQEKQPCIVCCSDENGQLSLDTTQMSLLKDMDISISVGNIGFITEKTTVLKSGYDYIIQSVIPNEYPFSVNVNNKTRITVIDSSKVKIKIGNDLESTLSKRIDNYSCSQCLFKVRE